MTQLEICCNSVQSAINAASAGARRIELCHNLEVGGLTPSPENIHYCVHSLGLRTHVLIRPRKGNFSYSNDEYDQICREVLLARDNGAAAVVVGLLTQDGRIDAPRTRELVRLAAPMEVTFHRAFDELRQDPLEALQQIIACGCHRLLTSGCQPTALQGLNLLKQLLASAAGRIILLVGSGVTPTSAPLLLSELLPLAPSPQCLELHGSCKQPLPNGQFLTDPSLVSQLLQITQ